MVTVTLSRTWQRDCGAAGALTRLQACRRPRRGVARSQPRTRMRHWGDTPRSRALSGGTRTGPGCVPRAQTQHHLPRIGTARTLVHQAVEVVIETVYQRLVEAVLRCRLRIG